jgi:hypothetical protein
MPLVTQMVQQPLVFTPWFLSKYELAYTQKLVHPALFEREDGASISLRNEGNIVHFYEV